MNSSAPAARPRVYIATPSHDHKFHAGFVFSLLRLASTHALDLTLSKVGGAGVARARNNMAQEFLATDCTHFFCIDADISFDPEHVLALLAHDRALVCGLYALKQREHAWCVTGIIDVEPDPITHLQRVDASGTGFMCIRREVFERMIAAHPEIAYHDDLAEARGRPRWDFFSMGVVDGRYLSEDWYFCHRARALGFACYVDASFHVRHEGLISYPIEKPATNAPARLWPDDIIAQGIEPDFCADVLAGCYDVPLAFTTPPVLLDIGANIGSFARWAAGRWPGCTIHCYEPHLKNFALLQRTNATITGATVACHPFAVTDKRATVTLHEGVDSGNHSLYDLGAQTGETQLVPALAASSLPAADILKIDTEGSELPILRSIALSENFARLRAIVLEYHRAEDLPAIVAFLEHRGFTTHAHRRHSDIRGELKFLRPAP